MLDAFIIEEIKRREEELIRENERPRLEIPAYIPYPQATPEPEEKKSTVIIIEM